MAIVGALCGAVVFTWMPGTALGHSILTDPPPRSTSISELPFSTECGNAAARGVPTVIEAGSTIQVSWTESVNHFGYFKLEFSPADDSNWMSLAMVQDPQSGTTTDWTTAVTLPDTPTATGTLRLSQWASNGAVSPTVTELHRSCADLQLLAHDTDGDMVRDDADLCPTAAGSGAPDGCPLLSRELTLKFPNRGEAFRGRLSASSSDCVEEELVRVFKVAAGQDKRVGAATTNTSGRYSLPRRRKVGRFYAAVAERLVPAAGTCAAEVSPVLRVR